MATYRSIASTETDPFAPLTSALMKALDENVAATAEGAAGAPPIQFEALGAWYTAFAGVGTFVFARCTGAVAFGATVAGSALFPTSAAREIYSSGANSMVFPSASALSGTWKCRGEYVVSVTGSPTTIGMAAATLWQRIA